MLIFVVFQPGNLTVYDIDWLAVWCIEYRHNFGHIFLPKDLDVPPALGQTKITVSLKCFMSISLKCLCHNYYNKFIIWCFYSFCLTNTYFLVALLTKPEWWYNPVSYNKPLVLLIFQ